MSSVNKIILLGRLGQDPEIKTMQSGGKVANLSLATSTKWTGKQTGEAKENKGKYWQKDINRMERYASKRCGLCLIRKAG